MAYAKLMSERKRKICELDAESIAYYYSWLSLLPTLQD